MYNAQQDLEAEGIRRGGCSAEGLASKKCWMNRSC